MEEIEIKFVVKDTKAGAQYCFAGLVGMRIHAPGDANARRQVAMVADVGLCLVAQPVAQCEVRPHAPVVVHKQANVELVHRHSGRAGIQPELSRAAAVLADSTSFTVLMLGGRVRGRTLATVDHWATRMLAGFVLLFPVPAVRRFYALQLPASGLATSR